MMAPEGAPVLVGRDKFGKKKSLRGYGLGCCCECSRDLSVVGGVWTSFLYFE